MMKKKTVVLVDDDKKKASQIASLLGRRPVIQGKHAGSNIDELFEFKVIESRFGAEHALETTLQEIHSIMPISLVLVDWFLGPREDSASSAFGERTCLSIQERLGVPAGLYSSGVFDAPVTSYRLSALGCACLLGSILDALERKTISGEQWWELLDRASSGSVAAERPVTDQVFVSYSFDGLEIWPLMSEKLTLAGFKPVDGKELAGSISSGISKRIQQSEFFLGVLTRDKELKNGEFSPSPWLLEEKGCAAGMGKEMVILVQTGVRMGGIQGDLQRIPFTDLDWEAKVESGVRQLEELRKRRR